MKLTGLVGSAAPAAGAAARKYRAASAAVRVAQRTQTQKRERGMAERLRGGYDRDSGRVRAAGSGGTFVGGSAPVTLPQPPAAVQTVLPPEPGRSPTSVTVPPVTVSLQEAVCHVQGSAPVPYHVPHP